MKSRLSKMNFSEFDEKFGGSFRNKNINHSVSSPVGALKQKIFNITRMKDANSRAIQHRKKNLRSYSKNFYSPLGRGFIRLCPWEAEYLYAISSMARVGIVEIGRFHGGSTFMLRCAAAKDVQIVSYDIAPQDDKKLVRLLDKYNLNYNISLITDSSFTTNHHHTIKYDMLWIDGDHSYDGCLNDLRRFYPFLTQNGHLLLHDCYATCEVMEAVNTFIKEEKTIRPVNNIFKPQSYWTDAHGSVAHLMKAG
jgi:predicted O-methyltransferase YrrM